MVQCDCLERCPFFHDKMEKMPGMAVIYKHRYCEGSSAECARYIVFEALGSANVPSDLFPNQIDRAREFIAVQVGADEPAGQV